MSRYSLRNGDNGIADQTLTTTADDTTISASTPDTETESLLHVKEEPLPSDEDPSNDEKALPHSPNFAKLSDDENEAEGENPPPKKQKHLSSLPANGEETPSMKKKSKKKNPNSIWTKPTSRRGKKKGKNNHSINNNNNAATAEDTVLITPVQRFPNKSDDAPEANICLSRVYKAEKVELSDDRLTAGSTKGYRMVRATRGVTEGTWYFEVRVLKLGETGHARLGWSNEKGDLQAPVGYDGNSFGYRDVDGSKVHKALREKYGEEGYKEGDVIGFYVSLPEGSLYEPKPPHFVWYKGQRYVCAPDGKEDPPKEVPGSEISFFKNGICQGVAFQNLYGGRYYPAASMYTLPNQPNCVVKFNFGPDFEFFPEDFGERPVPRPIIEVPYHGFDSKVENDKSLLSIRMCPTLKVVKEQDTEVMEDVDV